MASTSAIAVPVEVERTRTRAQTETAILDHLAEIGKAALSNPIVAGLGALAVNQGLYKLGFWDPRMVYDDAGEPVINVKTFDAFSIHRDGIDIAKTEWSQVRGEAARLEAEKQGSQNATTIGMAIIAATALAAAGGLSGVMSGLAGFLGGKK